MHSKYPTRFRRVGFFFVILVCAVLVGGQFSTAQAQPQGAMGVVTGRITHQTAAAQSSSIFGRLVNLKLETGPTRGQLARALYQPQGRIFLQIFSDGSLQVWDFDRSALIDERQLPQAAVPVYYDAATGQVIAIDDGRLIRFGRAKDGKPVATTLLEERVNTAVASSDARAIFAGMASGEVIRLNSGGGVVWRQQVLGSAVREIASDAKATRLAVLDDVGVAQVLDGAGNKLFGLSDITRLGGFDRAGRQTHASRQGVITTFSPQGAVVRRENIGGVSVASLAINESGDRMLLVSSDGKLTASGQGGWTEVDAGVRHAYFVAGKRYLAVKRDGVTHLRSVDLAHYLLALVPGATGWVIVDHEGRYDGSVDGTKDVRWTAEAASLNLDQFFDKYFQPGLLSAYIHEEEGKVLGSTPARPTEGVFLPAKVELEFPDGAMKPGVVASVVAVAESQGGDILEDIRLFHNGKRLPSKAKVGSQKVQKDGRLLVVQVFQFVPETGANEVFAEVRNIHGLSGRSEVKREVTDGFRSPGTLHVVGLGIDKYRVSKINLDFATADARAVVGKVGMGASKRYERINRQIVVDANATGRGIRNLLGTLAKMEPQDSLILMLAGHGDIANGEWYFLPHDVDLKDVARTGISAKELQDALVNAPVRRIFLLVDACNSGSGIDSFNRYRALQRRISQQVGRDVGVTVLTATRRDQAAAEMPELGHGVFTHVILEGLAGGADTSPRDSQVSVHELANFVARNLEDKARPFAESFQFSQTPTHFVIGADFLLSDTGR